MRRATLVVSLAMLMALAFAAISHAASISASGVIGFRSAFGGYWNSADKELNYRLNSQIRQYSNLYLRGSKGNVSAYVFYRLRGDKDGWYNMNATGNFDNSTTVRGFDAYIEFNGALFPGAPSGRLRAGRYASTQHQWIGRFTRRDAIQYTGLKLGPATFDLYHGLPSHSTTATSIKASGSIDMVDLMGIYVMTTNHNNKDASFADWLLEATVKPIRNVSVTGQLVSNGKANDDSVFAWTVKGEVNTIPNFALRGSVWSVPDDFSPTYIYVEDWQEIPTMDHSFVKRPNALPDPWMQTGFSAGVTTRQAGLPIELDFKMGKTFESGNNLPAALHDKSMIVAEAGTTVAQINTKVAVTMIEDEDPVIDIAANRNVNVAVLGGNVNVRGTLRLLNDDDIPARFGADATWSAPNGITLGVHYANYDRKTDWNHNGTTADISEGFDIGEPGKADGFAITAGYQLSF